MNIYKIRGFCGSLSTPCCVLVAEADGGKYYVVQGGCSVNFTHDNLENGVNVETVMHADTFTWSKGVDTLDQLEHAINT